MSGVKYKNLGGLQGRDNLTGMRGNLLIAPRRYFETIAATPFFDGENTAVADVEALVKITDNHVFKAGFGFHEFYCTRDQVELMLENMGERDSRGFNVKINAKTPSFQPLVLGTARMAKNEDFIVLVQDTNNGRWFQVGSDGLEATVLFNGNSGKLGDGGYKGFDIVIESYDNVLPIYEGEITILPNDEADASVVSLIASTTSLVVDNATGDIIFTASLDKAYANVPVTFQLSTFLAADITAVNGAPLGAALVGAGVTPLTNALGIATITVTFAAAVDKNGVMTASISQASDNVSANSSDNVFVTVDTTEQ